MSYIDELHPTDVPAFIPELSPDELDAERWRVLLKAVRGELVVGNPRAAWEIMLPDASDHKQETDADVFTACVDAARIGQ